MVIPFLLTYDNIYLFCNAENNYSLFLRAACSSQGHDQEMSSGVGPVPGPWYSLMFHIIFIYYYPITLVMIRI